MKLVQKFAVVYIRTRLRLVSYVSVKKAAQIAFDLFCTPQIRVVRKLPALFEKGEPIRLAFGDYTIAGYRWNKGQERKVLLVHGFESTMTNFEHYIGPLIEKGYEVLAFDAPAHGRSSGTMMNALVYRDFIIHIHAEYGPVQSFLGHSFGGLAVCLALSEINHDNSYRIALIAPATSSTTAMEYFFEFLKMHNKDVKQGFEKLVFDTGGQPMSWYSIPRTLENIQARLLWVHDEDDEITPLKDLEIVRKENHPGIQFVITKGLGHTRIYRDAAISRVVVDFL